AYIIRMPFNAQAIIRFLNQQISQSIQRRIRMLADNILTRFEFKILESIFYGFDFLLFQNRTAVIFMQTENIRAGIILIMNAVVVSVRTAVSFNRSFFMRTRIFSVYNSVTITIRTSV